MAKTVPFTKIEDVPLSLSVKTVAKLLDISESLAYKLVNSESFPKVRIGKRICIPRTAFLEFMQKNYDVVIK